MKLNREHFRALIFYDYRKGLTKQQCANQLHSIFGDEAPSLRSVSNWYNEFKNGRNSLEDGFRKGRPKSAVLPETVDAVREMINQDPHVTYRQIEASVGISSTSVHKILHEHLAMGKLNTMSEENPENPKSVYDFMVKDTYDNDIPLDKYKGKVLLIVNIASRCGHTKKNYKELTELVELYKDKDFKILSFPCNQFGKQMPQKDGDAMMEHLEKKDANVGDVFKKIDVNGANAAPLYKFLKEKQGAGDRVKWNFVKFLVDKNGEPVERYGSSYSPKNIAPKIDELLKE